MYTFLVKDFPAALVRGLTGVSMFEGAESAAFKTDPKAWTFFQTLSARNRRDFVVWIYTAKRPETRERRIREAIDLLAAGKNLGLK